jgi:hypothetical protein
MLGILFLKRLVDTDVLGDALRPALKVSGDISMTNTNLPLKVQLAVITQPSHEHGCDERAELAAGMESVHHVLEAAGHQFLTSGPVLVATRR